jgi:hypothetical protein
MAKHLLIVLTTFLLAASTSLATDSLSPVQVAQLTYDRYLGDDMQMRGTMELISKKGHVRTREYISQRKDSEENRSQLIRFTAPADIDGTAFLTIEKDLSTNTEQHLYLPALKRTRRIVASQKGRSFVNSDFTYEDMQRHSVEAWDYQLDGEEVVLGKDCYILVSTPKASTDTQYGKTIAWIEKGNFIPLKTVFWDKKGQQSKLYQVVSFEMIDQVATETEVLMEDLGSGHMTRLKVLAIEYNNGLKDSLFTARALER